METLLTGFGWLLTLYIELPVYNKLNSYRIINVAYKVSKKSSEGRTMK